MDNYEQMLNRDPNAASLVYRPHQLQFTKYNTARTQQQNTNDIEDLKKDIVELSEHFEIRLEFVKENFNFHLNKLKEENKKLKDEIEDLKDWKNLVNDFFETQKIYEDKKKLEWENKSYGHY